MVAEELQLVSETKAALHTKRHDHDEANEVAFEFSGASFIWDENQNDADAQTRSALIAPIKPTLERITLSVRRGQLIAIVGSVGAGLPERK